MSMFFQVAILSLVFLSISLKIGAHFVEGIKAFVIFEELNELISYILLLAVALAVVL